MCYRRRQVGKEPHPHIGGAGLPCRSGRGGCRQAERVYIYMMLLTAVYVNRTKESFIIKIEGLDK